MRKSLYLLLVFLSCCLLPAAIPLAHAVPQMDILNFNSYIELGNEDKILVTEEIHAYIPTSGTNRGMYRDIPINSRWRDKGRQQVELEIRHVSIDGKPQSLDDIENNYPFLRIYLRDRNSCLSAGTHTFVLQYTMTQQIGFFENNDELTWNVTGSGWAGSIKNSFCMVLPPHGTEFTDYRAWIGRFGSMDSPVNVHRQLFSQNDLKVIIPDFLAENSKSNEREALVFTARRPIQSGEDFTVAAALPKGSIQAPIPVNPEDETWFTLSLIVLLVLAIGWSWMIWNKYGRDPKVGPAIPLFYPPKIPAHFQKFLNISSKKDRKIFRRGLRSERFTDGNTDENMGENNSMKENTALCLSAPAVNFIWNKTFTAKGLASLFISLAERGDCRLHGNEDDGFSIEFPHNTAPKTPHQEELDAIADAPAHISLQSKPDEISLKALQNIWLKCGSRLKIAFTAEWKQNALPMLLCFVPSLLGLVFLCWLNLGSLNAIPGDIEDTLFGLAFVFFAFFAMLSMVRKMRGPIFLRILFGVAFFGVVFTLLGAALAELFADVQLDWLFSPLQWGLMALVVLAPAPFACFMDAPSAEIARLHREIEGLALYIGMAEKDRLNFANPPDKPLELYHRLLPYAVALGLEEAWGARFAEELASAQNQLQGEMHNRQMQTTRILGSSSFMGALASSASHSVSAHQAAARASSVSRGSSFGGGGGGGGAGSGGGGGGGGAC